MSSLFGKMFGAKPAKESTSSQEQKNAQVQKAISDINDTTALLQKKIDLLDKKVLEELNQAKKLNAANKRQQAMVHMKRKARYAKQAKDIEGQINTLEAQQAALETVQQQKMVANTLENTHAVLKAQTVDVDKVHDLMDEIQENIDQGEEVTAAMSTPLGQTFDDAALEDELDAMGLDLDKVDELDELDELSALPSVPSARVPAVAEPDDDFADLHQWANQPAAVSS